MIKQKTITRNTSDPTGYFVLRSGKLPPPKISFEKESVVSTFLVKLILISLFTLMGGLASYVQITTATVNTNPYCIGGNTGSVKITANTGTPPFTFQQISPSVGPVNVVSAAPYAYTFNGLTAGTYTFRVIDAASQTTNRVITLTNPNPASYGANSGQRGSVVVCDSIDYIMQLNSSNIRPGFKYEFWFNSSTATGSPTQVVNTNGINQTFRLPLANIGSVHTAKLTDSCGTSFTQTITTNFLNFYAAATQVCNQTSMGINYRGLKVPISFKLYSGSAATGSPIQTSAVTTDTYSPLFYNYNDGGSMSNVPAGTYTLTATDACGRTLTFTGAYTPATKSITNSLNCSGTYADKTSAFRVQVNNLTTPLTISVLSGPTTYTGTASSDIMDNTISTYPVTYNVTSVPANQNYTFANAPAGTYKIAVTDACGWTDTSLFTVNIGDLVTRTTSSNLVAGCLDAHTLTETVTRANCASGSNEVNASHLVNASTGVSVPVNTYSGGLNYTQTYNNVPSGTYYLRYASTYLSILSQNGKNGRNGAYIYYQDTLQALYVQPSVSGLLAAPCPNSTVGSLIATIKDGSAPFTYEVLDSFPYNTVIRAAQSSNTFTGLPLNSKYRVRVLDNCGNSVVSNNISFAGITSNVAARTSITCSPLGGTVTLTADSLNATTYAWSGPNGYSASGRIVSVPSFAAANVGTYKVVSTTVGNCLDSATVVVNQKPNAGSDRTVCQFQTATMTGVTFTGGTVWSAQTGNPTAATITNTASPTTTITGLNTAGTYRYLLTSTANNCIDTALVRVNAKPNAGVNKTVCQFQTATMSATASSGASWSALVSNPSTATITNTATANTTITNLATAGSYSLLWTSSLGCSDTAVVIVNAKANAGVDKTLSCYYSDSAIMSGVGTGTWVAQAGNPGTATIVTPNSATTTIKSFSGAGVYRFIFNNAAGCADTAIITANNGCNGCFVTGNTISSNTTNYCNTVSSVVINGSTPTPTGGTYRWIQSINNGAYTTATGTSTGVNYTTGSLSVGTYVYKRIYSVTTPTACSDTSFPVTITVNSLPTIAAISGTTGVCIGSTTDLDNTTIDGDWKSVNTNIATINASGEVTGVTAGNSVIRYTVTNANGCIDSVSATVTVSGKPNAGLDLIDICTGSSTDLIGLPSGGTWNAQDGSTGFTLGTTNAGVANLLFTNSSAAGEYNFVYAVNGCTDTVNIITKACCTKPIFSAKSLSICEGENTTLTITNGKDSSATSIVNTVYNNNFDSLVGGNWSFTNESSVGIPKVINFSNITVLGYLGAQKATFTMNTIPKHDSIEVAFDLYIHDSWDGNNSSGVRDIWKMDINGVNIINTTFSNYNYRTQAFPDNIGVNNPGLTGAAAFNLGFACNIGGKAQTTKYRIVKKVAHNNNNLTIDLSGINLESLCNESWSMDNFEVNLITIPILSNVSWLNPDNGTVSGSQLLVQPNSTKYFIAQLDGCSDSLLVKVKSTPKANFTINDSTQCIGATNFSFTNSSTISDGSLLTYTWLMPGASIISSNNTDVFDITYANAGINTVTLIAKAIGNECADSISSISKFVMVNPKSTILINKTNLNSCGSIFEFSYNGDSSSCVWSFGNGNTSTENNPTINYTNKGVYQVKLLATNSNGCISTDSIDVNIDSVPVSNFASFSVQYTGACGNMVTLTNNSTGNDNKYLWDFGDGNTSKEVNPTHYYVDGGEKNITLSLINEKGCGNTAFRKVKISNNSGKNGRVGVVFSVTPNAVQILQGNKFGFKPVYTDNNDNVPPLFCAGAPTWYYGDGTGSNYTTISNKKYVQPGVYTVRILQKTTGTGCFAEASKVITVLPTPLLIPVVNKINSGPEVTNSEDPTNVEGVFDNVSKVELYPNPNAGTFKVKYSGLDLENGLITIVNILGQEVFRTNLKTNFSNNEIEINNLNIANGTYYLVISSKGVTKARKQFVNIAE
jgi:PKD repeat protein